MLTGRARQVVALVGVLGLAAGGQASSSPGRSRGGAATYTLAKGDTLSTLARRLGVSLTSLAAVNGIADRDRVRAGTRLVVPGAAADPGRAGPATHTVEKGDTLSTLARRLGVSLTSLAAVNGIADRDRVRAGTRLVVPGAAADPGRAGPAPVLISTSSHHPDAALPDGLLQHPERLVLMPHFDAAAREFGVPPDLFKAMTWLESGWQNHKVSSTRAVGIGQLMPDTVAFVNGVLLRARLDPGRPEHNIRMSARFLAYLLHQTRGDESLGLASYYQGLASVRRRGPLPETHRYVANVMALRKKF